MESEEPQQEEIFCNVISEAKRFAQSPPTSLQHGTTDSARDYGLPYLYIKCDPGNGLTTLLHRLVGALKDLETAEKPRRVTLPVYWDYRTFRPRAGWWNYNPNAVDPQLETLYGLAQACCPVAPIPYNPLAELESRIQRLVEYSRDHKIRIILVIDGLDHFEDGRVGEFWRDAVDTFIRAAGPSIASVRVIVGFHHGVRLPVRDKMELKMQLPAGKDVLAHQLTRLIPGLAATQQREILARLKSQFTHYQFDNLLINDALLKNMIANHEGLADLRGLLRDILADEEKEAEPALIIDHAYYAQIVDALLGRAATGEVKIERSDWVRWATRTYQTDPRYIHHSHFIKRQDLNTHTLHPAFLALLRDIYDLETV